MVALSPKTAITFGISQKSLIQPFPNVSFPLTIQFYFASQSPNGCDFAL